MPETNARIKVCHDTAANFKTNNPTLLVGEWALETDTKKMKIGDGSTAYNALPYSTAEDSDEWRKPADWVDIRSAALPNSVYFLVAHSVPTLSEGTYSVATYPQFAVYAEISSSGTYDVFVDGIKVATTNSAAVTTIDWATLYNNGTIVGGQNVTYPSTLTTHVVRVTPTSNTNTINWIRRDTSNNAAFIGVLWVHFELTNIINIKHLFGPYQTTTSIVNICEAVTATGDKITITNQLLGSFRAPLKHLPVIDLNNTTYCEGFNAFTGVKCSKIRIQNGQMLGYDLFKYTSATQIGGNNFFVQPGNEAFRNNLNLKSLPGIAVKNLFSANNNYLTITFGGLLQDCPSLKDTQLDLSKYSFLKRLAVGGSSSSRIDGLKGFIVSPEAPFDNSISPQLDVSYTGLSRAALVNMFKSMPYNVGYTVVGTPIISNGVVSNLSSTNYAKTSKSFSINDVAFEIQTQFTTPANSDLRILSIPYHFYIHLYSNGVIEVLTRDTSRTAHYNSSSSSDFRFSGSTTYKIKLTYSNAMLSLYVFTNDDWLQIMNENISSCLIDDYINLGYQSSESIITTGSIDLNNTSIKLNGVTWFNGAATRQLSSDITAVGSPSIVNGVASGFSASKYLQAQQLPADFWTNDFEICVALKTPTSWPSGDAYLLKGSRRRVGDTGSDTGILTWWTNNKLAMTGSYKNISGSAPFGVEIVPELNTMYFMKMVQVGHTISGYYSLDGSSWTLLNTADDYGYAGTPDTLNTLFGQDVDCSGFSIDLNSTYIKSGSSIWLRPMAPMVKTCSVVGCAGTADLTADDKAIATGKGWSLTDA